MNKFDIVMIVTAAFAAGILGGIHTQEVNTQADLAELGQWRAAYAYQLMQEPDEIYELPAWCKMIQDGNYGYDWSKK